MSNAKTDEDHLSRLAGVLTEQWPKSKTLELICVFEKHELLPNGFIVSLKKLFTNEFTVIQEPISSFNQPPTIKAPQIAKDSQFIEQSTVLDTKMIQENTALKVTVSQLTKQIQDLNDKLSISKQQQIDAEKAAKLEERNKQVKAESQCVKQQLYIQALEKQVTECAQLNSGSALKVELNQLRKDIDIATD